MDIFNYIIDIVNNVGFPIAVCVYMFYYTDKTTKELEKTLEKNTEAMNELISKIDLHYYSEHGENL